MMELYASCRQVRTPLRRLCLGVLEKLPLLCDRFFAGLLTVGGPALGYSKCRDAAKIDKTRLGSLTRLRRVGRAC
jgi:hypothetical protein